MLDEVELDDWFAVRVPTLRSCPNLRGGLRCFAITLREQCRAKIEGDEAAEAQACFTDPDTLEALEGMAKRADDIAQGHWRGLLDSVRTFGRSGQEMTSKPKSRPARAGAPAKLWWGPHSHPKTRPL